MPRLYADENILLPLVEELRRLGHDVLTTQEAGLAGQAVPDDAVIVPGLWAAAMHHWCRCRTSRWRPCMAGRSKET
jgi:hypothetical protein